MIDLQILRGSAATTPTADTYVGPPGELVADEDLWALRLQDGTTPGGHLISSSTPASLIIEILYVTTGTSTSLLSLTSTRTAAIWTSATGGAKTTTLPDP